MNSEELKPLFKYLDEFRAEVNQRFDRVDTHQDGLGTAVQSLAKEVKDFRDEHIILYKKIERLEDWAKQVSDKLGIPLPH